MKCACRGRKGENLNYFEIIDTFTYYGVDVLVLALATVGIVQLIKITVFKHAQKKLLTFLPFVVGTVLYAVYAAISHLSFTYVIEEYASILEHGVSVGAAATLYYVVYEQFVREKKGLSEVEQIIATLIEKYLPKENVEKAAKTIAEAIAQDVTGNGAVRAREILTEYSDGEISENDIQLLSRLIIETLAHLTTSK